MKFEFLLDSDHTIDHLRGVPTASALVSQLSVRGIAISAMTFAEVFEGVLFGRGRPVAEHVWTTFVDGVSVLPLDEHVAKHFAQIRGRLRADGNIIPDADIWIAATAIEHDLTLVTGNRRHFDRVPGLRVLS